MNDRRSRGALHAFVGAPLSTQTYRNLAYALVSAPLGLAYFVLLTTATSLTIGLSLTLLGPVVLSVSLVAIPGIAWIDGRLTEGVLGADVDPRSPSTRDGLAATLKTLYLGRTTWAGIGYLIWRSLAGFAALVALAVGLSLAIGLLSAPLAYGSDLVVDYRLGSYAVDTFGRSLVAAGGGVAVLVVVLHAGNLFGRISAAVAAKLLGDSDPEPTEGPRPDRNGSIDGGPAIDDEPSAEEFPADEPSADEGAQGDGPRDDSQ